MTILVSGGGTGGHITPLLAVAHELKELQPAARVVCISEKGGKFNHLIEQDNSIDEHHFISAGKFRRYHGESLIVKLTDIRTLFLNMRDFFRFVRGKAQSKRLISTIKPDVVFIKGGFVGVPVGLAAARAGIPIVTHDSDTTAGLANRLLAKHVTVHATGMPTELYSYPKDTMRYTGIPVAKNFKVVSETQKIKARQKLGIPDDDFVVLATGGSQGARNLNKIIQSQYSPILGLGNNVRLIHQVGKGNLSKHGYTDERLSQLEFTEEFAMYSAAADVVICRSSATTLAELGLQQRAIITVPSPFLAGGHQLKNAQLLADKQAAIVLQENELIAKPTVLTDNLAKLYKDSKDRQDLAKNLHAITKPDAAKELAQLLIDTVREH